MANEAFLYPLTAALLIALLAWARKRESGSRCAWAPALAWGLGFALAYFGLKGALAPLPPKEVGHWHFYAMLVAIPIAALQGRGRSVAHFFLGLALLAGFFWLSSASLREYEWEGDLVWKMPALIAGVSGLAFLLNSDLVRARPAGIQVLGAFAMTLGASAFVLGQSTGGTAHLAGGLACVALPFGIVALARSKDHVAYGSSLPFTLGLCGLLFTGVFFASTPWVSAVLLVLAPQAIRFGWPLKSPAARFAVSVLACALVCGIAAYLGYSPEEPSGY